MRLLFRAWNVLRQEGLVSFFKKMLVYLDSKTGLVSPFIALYVLYIRKRIKSLDDALDLAFGNNFIGMLIRPAQEYEEIRQFLEMLESVKPKRILEIGTALGGTLFLWTQIASSDAVIISIDLPGGPFGGGYPFLRKMLYYSFKKEKQKIFLIRADSHNVKTLLKVKDILRGECLDLLFIDGDHTYNGVETDYKLYSSLVCNGGIIAFHDIVPGSKEIVGDVPRFWNEIKQTIRRYSEIVKDWNQGKSGIGVIYYET